MSQFDLGFGNISTLGQPSKKEEKRRARVSWIAIVSLLTASVILIWCLRLGNETALVGALYLIGLQKKLSNLDAQVQSKEDERARIIVQLKEAGLSEAQKAALQIINLKRRIVLHWLLPLQPSVRPAFFDLPASLGRLRPPPV